MGSTDISDLGSTVTGAISSLKGARLIYSIPANTYSTNATALSVLNTYYLTLPDDVKYKTFLTRAVSDIFYITDSNGSFQSIVSWESSGVTYVQIISIGLLSSKLLVTQMISTNPAPVFNDLSSDLQKHDLNLYAM